MDGNKIKSSIPLGEKIKSAWKALFGKYIGLVFFNDTPIDGDTITVDNMVAIFHEARKE